METQVVELDIGGFKHSAVLIIAATVAIGGRFLINNLPLSQTDILVLKKHIERNGGTFLVRKCGTTEICTSLWPKSPILAKADLGSVHGSLYLLPAQLARHGIAKLFVSGGCAIGNGRSRGRPTEHIERTMKLFGARPRADSGRSETLTWDRQCPQKLCVRTISRGPNSETYASGVTKTAIILALASNREIEIENFYGKRDVLDLLKFLNHCGITNRTVGNTIVVEGQNSVQSQDPFHLASDSLEVLTYIALSFFTNRNVFLNATDAGEVLQDLAAEVRILRTMGFGIELMKRGLLIAPPSKISPCDIKAELGGIYSDSQPLLSVLAIRSDCSVTVSDQIWRKRFDHLLELQKVGLRSRIDNGSAEIYPSQLNEPAEVLSANDLRSAVAIVLFLIGMRVKATVSGISHIDRGYEHFFNSLRRCGVNFRKFDDEIRLER